MIKDVYKDNSTFKGRTYYIPVVMLALTILFAAVYMICWGIQKEGYNTDEIYSLMIIRGGGLGRPYNYDDFWNTWQDASGLESTIGVSAENAFSAVGKYRSVYQNLLHIAYSFSPDNITPWPSIILNIIFLSGSLIVIYLLSLHFIDNKYLALLPGILWSVSSAAVNIVMFIRFYTFKIFICLLLTYIVLLFIKKQGRNWGYLTAIAVITYIGTHIHQYFFVYAFFLSVAVCVYLLLKKEITKTVMYACSAISAVVINQIQTNYWIIRMFTSPIPDGHEAGVHERNRSVEAVINLVHGSDGYTARIGRFLTVVSEGIFANINPYIMIFMIAILMGIVYTSYKRTGLDNTALLKKQKVSFGLILASTCALYILMIARIAPYFEIRYISCTTPVIMILFVSLMVKALGIIGFRKTVTIFFITLVPCFLLLVSNISDNYIMRGHKRPAAVISPYYHLPVIKISSRVDNIGNGYWYLFEFENEVLFAVRGNEDYDVIKQLSFDDGLILMLHGSVNIADTGRLFEAAGLSKYTHLTFSLAGNIYLLH